MLKNCSTEMIVTIDAHRFGRELAAGRLLDRAGRLLDRAERQEVREPVRRVIELVRLPDAQVVLGALVEAHAREVVVPRDRQSRGSGPTG